MNFSDATGSLLLRAPGASQPLLERALKNGAREFCRKTWAWDHETVAEFKIGDRYGDLDLPAGTIACGVIRYLDPARGVGIGIYRGKSLAVAREYISDVSIGVVVALAPSEGAADIPDWLWDEHGEAMLDFATHELLMMHTKPWVNEAMAAEFYRSFLDQVNDIKRALNTRHANGRPMMNRARMGV